MLTMKDVADKAGVCWRYTDKGAPDHYPTYNLAPGEKDETSDGWTIWDVERPDEPSRYTKKHGHRRIELLEHYSMSPTPTLLKNPLYDVKYVTVQSDLGAP